MAWTDRPDDEPCCGEDPGPVAKGEQLAHLVHAGNFTPPEAVPFKRADLMWEGKKTPFDNTCGLADGLSVDRCNDLSDEELRKRAAAQAAKKPGRASRGAIVASVDDLRAIPPHAPGAPRPVYVYDDPMIGNREHAVMRVVPPP